MLMTTPQYTPEWLRRERAEVNRGERPFDRSWDYLKGRGVPYNHYRRMAEERYARENMYRYTQPTTSSGDTSRRDVY